MTQQTGKPRDEFSLENAASVETEETQKFLTNAPSNSQKALSKVEAIQKVIDGAVRCALQRTVPADWVMMGKSYYLQASGVEKIRGVFGLYFRDRVIVKEDLGDGSYAYICSGTAGSRLLDGLFGEETTVEIEGIRSSKDPFFTGKDGNKEFDAMDVRKAAFANFTVRAAKALLGIGNYNDSDLQKMGVPFGQVTKVGFQGGGEGGGQTALVSAAQVNRLMAIANGAKVTDAAIKEYILKKYGYKSKSDIERKNYDAIVEWAKAGGGDEPGAQG